MVLIQDFGISKILEFPENGNFELHFWILTIFVASHHSLHNFISSGIVEPTCTQPSPDLPLLRDLKLASTDEVDLRALIILLVHSLASNEFSWLEVNQESFQK